MERKAALKLFQLLNLMENCTLQAPHLVITYVMLKILTLNPGIELMIIASPDY